ncbi:nitrate reductase molybdenum cofactor assembly chaperone [Streptomyces sp. MNU89]|uniref:nitrate reductase molybdenum cofactor assembly chaperone n=1 Tax=Streptomyces sp. MNU89 TaxID=2560025 RepID=UPI0035A8C99C
MSPLNPLQAVRTRIRPAARRPADLTPEERETRCLLLRLCSLLLQYPDDELAAARAVLDSSVRALPDSPAAAELAEFAGWFTATGPDDLRRHYVEVFDLRRKSSLYLTYYLHGDTRRRGMALLTLAQCYRATGWESGSGELPDHLPVVLEYAALTGTAAGEAPLRRHRRGLELIRRSLGAADSPYEHVLAALLALLPPATDADLRAVAELAAAGPPAEDVGLDPFDGGVFAPPGTFVPPAPEPPTRVPAPGPAAVPSADPTTRENLR